MQPPHCYQISSLHDEDIEFSYLVHSKGNLYFYNIQLFSQLFFQLIQLLNRRKLSESELSHIGDIQIAFNTKLYEQYPDTKRKQKIHHNLHTEEMIRQHGVPIGYTTGNVIHIRNVILSVLFLYF